MKKLLISILLVGLLTSCAGTTIVQTKVIEVPKIDPPLPDPIIVQNVSWHIYNSQELIQLATQQKDIILYTMTPNQVQTLGYNLSEIQRYVLQSKQVILFYRSQNAESNNLSNSPSK